MSRSEIEDDMDFSGLAPTAAERRQEAYERTRNEVAAAREAQLARMTKLARELSDALITVRPLGGSELFKRVGEEFYADAHYCGLVIKQMQDDLHALRKENVLLKRQLSALPSGN